MYILLSLLSLIQFAFACNDCHLCETQTDFIFFLIHLVSDLSGMNKEAAEQAYITKVEQMKGTYGF